MKIAIALIATLISAALAASIRDSPQSNGRNNVGEGNGLNNNGHNNGNNNHGNRNGNNNDGDNNGNNNLNSHNNGNNNGGSNNGNGNINTSNSGNNNGGSEEVDWENFIPDGIKPKNARLQKTRPAVAASRVVDQGNDRAEPENSAAIRPVRPAGRRVKPAPSVEPETTSMAQRETTTSAEPETTRATQPETTSTTTATTTTESEGAETSESTNTVSTSTQTGPRVRNSQLFLNYLLYEFVTSDDYNNFACKFYDCNYFNQLYKPNGKYHWENYLANLEDFYWRNYDNQLQKFAKGALPGESEGQ